MIANLYRGYNSWAFEDDKSFTVKDIELVKVDLLNHIFTKRGERVMMPRFGTQIPEMIFEPLTEETVDIVYEELEYVFNYDPRVEIIRLNVIPNYERSSIYAIAKLWYIELNMDNVLELNIEFGI